MKKVIKISESELIAIARKIILESEENDSEKLSSEDWEDIWFKLRKINKSFSAPDDNIFSFGGLFFHYRNGHLSLPSQKLSDWREDTQKAAEILDNYVKRIKSAFKESDLDLKLKVDDDYSMKIYKD